MTSHNSHQKIFYDCSSDEEEAGQNAPTNVAKKVQNPTYISQIFGGTSQKDVNPTVKQLLTESAVSNSSRNKQKVEPSTSQPAGIALKRPQTVQHKAPQTEARTKDKQLPFNAMWWDSNSHPNNDPSQFTENFAKERKFQDFTANNIFSQASYNAKPPIQNKPPKIPVNEAAQSAGQSLKSNQQGEGANGRFNIITNTKEDGNAADRKQAAEQLLKEQKQANDKDDSNNIEQRKANRNYSNLFGRCQSATNVLENNESKNKTELFLPANANIDKFDSQRYNPKTEKENSSLNACERHFKNLKSVLDTHDHAAEFKRGCAIHPKKNELEAMSEVQSEISVIEKPVMKPLRVGEMEKVGQIDTKGTKNHFDLNAFKRFCAQKGYRLLHYITSENGRGQIFLRETRKNPDPIDSIVSNLKVNGTTVSLAKEISGKEFNAKAFMAFEKPAKKPALISRPQTGKKQFSQNNSSIQQSAIFH